MSLFNRAAASAAVLLVAVSGTLYAGPSRAWEFTTPAVVPSESGSAIAPSATDQTLASPATGEAVVPLASPTEVMPSVAVETLPQPVNAPVRRSLADLVAAHADARTRSAEHECLANAVYFESKGEPLAGQLSVAEVVVNRARSGRFPASVCGVVRQKAQFSFVRGGRLPSVPRNSAAWHKAVAIAHIALADLADGSAPRALFFHAKRVKPSWRGLRRIASVGNHVFYR
jgi:spore germination cell wall hydrolase CwlJ-like protein